MVHIDFLSGGLQGVWSDYSYISTDIGNQKQNGAQILLTRPSGADTEFQKWGGGGSKLMFSTKIPSFLKFWNDK